MKHFNLKKRNILVLFILFSGLLHAQIGVIGLDTEKDLKEKAIEAVSNYYSSLQILGITEIQQDKEEIQRDAIKTFFNNNRNVQVYNDLSEGSEIISVQRYLENMSVLFKKGVAIDAVPQSLANSKIYYDESSFLVKVVVDVSIQGENTQGQTLNKTTKLDAFVKYIVRSDNSINTSAVISNILGHQDSDDDKLGGFKPITVSTSETNTSYTVDNTEYDKRMEKVKEIEARLIQEEETINRIKNELALREKQIKQKEIELDDEKKITELKRQKAEQESIEAERQIEAARLAKQEAERQRLDAERQKAEAEAARLEAERKALLLKSERFVINVGAGIYKHVGLLEQVINKQETPQSFATQINATLGYRFDINVNNNAARKINRGTILGAFARYGLNTQDIVNSNNSNQNLQIHEDKLEPIYNHYMELEAGFVFSELLRTSFGVGKQYDKSYFVSTVALNLNLGKLIWEIGATGMFGKDFQKLQIRPATSLAFQFNERNPKNLKGYKSGFFSFELNPEIAYNLPMSSTKGTAETNSLSYQTNTFFGFKISKKSKIGVFGTFGINPNGISQNILESNQLQASYAPNGDYNPYIGIEAGALIRNWRVSYGIGEFNYLNNKALPYQSMTVGIDVRLYKTLRFTLNSSTMVLNEDFTRLLVRISSGLALRFDYVR